MVQRPIACVTGASSGIGEQFARLLAERGYDLVLVARRSGRLEALASQLERVQRASCEVIAVDLTTSSGRGKVLSRLAAGDVETMVNDAGFGSYGALVERAAAESSEMIQLNVLALTLLSRAAAAEMVRRRGGKLCNVSSIASFSPGSGAAVYHATKAYVTSFTEALHEEVRRYGVHVTAVCPGFTPTSFHERAGIMVRRVPRLATTSADVVARRALEALDRNDSLCVPGRLDHLLTSACRLAPRPLVRWGTAKVVEGLAMPARSSRSSSERQLELEGLLGGTAGSWSAGADGEVSLVPHLELSVRLQPGPSAPHAAPDVEPGAELAEQAGQVAGRAPSS